MRKRIQLTFIVIALTAFNGYNQPDYQWSVTAGGIENDQAKTIDLTIEDKVIVTGNYLGTVDFDPGMGNADLVAPGSGFDFAGFIWKLDQEGNYEWVKNILPTGGFNGVSIRDAVIDDNDHIVLAGAMDGDIVFDTLNHDTLFSVASGQNAFVVKYDSDGNFVWGYNFGASQNQYANAVDVDASGNVYVGGYYSNAMVFSEFGAGSLNSNGGTDGFIMKIDPQGNLLWSHTIGGPNDDRVNTINVRDNGEVILGGNLTGDFDIDPGAGTLMTGTNETAEAFAVKLNSTGDFQWMNLINGGSGFDLVTSISETSAQNIILGGSFRATVDFGPGTGTNTATSNGQSDIFILEIDQNGDYVNHMAFGGNGSDEARKITIGNNDELFVAGSFNGTVDFDPSGNTTSKTSSGQSDGFLASYDSNLGFSWVESIGSSDFDNINEVAVNYQGAIYATGIFRQSVDLDPNGGVPVTSAGDYDFYVQVLGDCFNKFHSVSQTACNSYFLNNGNEVNQSGVYYDTIQIASSCDSIVSINLDLTSIDSTVNANGGSLSANMNGATYQWLDCNNGNSPMNGETNQSFNAQNDGSYAVEISMNGCTSTSECVVVNTLSVDEENVDLLIYPNPASSSIKVEWDLGQLIELKLLDMHGKLLKIHSFTGATSIDLNSIAPGVYILELNSSGDRKREQIIISK